MLAQFRIVKAYARYSRGDLISPPAILRDQLLRGGFIEPVEAEVRTAMEAPVKKRGRGRHQKNRVT